MNAEREMTEAATGAVHPECYQGRGQPHGPGWPPARAGWSTDDFVDSVSGTHGHAGAAHTTVPPRQSAEGRLKVTGRDVPEGEYAHRIVGGTTWQLDGASLSDAAAVARKRDDTRALGGVSLQVLAAVEERPDGIWARDLKDRFGADVYKYLARLADEGRVEKRGRGFYGRLSKISNCLVKGPAETDSGPGLPKTGPRAAKGANPMAQGEKLGEETAAVPEALRALGHIEILEPVGNPAHGSSGDSPLTWRKRRTAS
jgi:hypothetical protein